MTNRPQKGDSAPSVTLETTGNTNIDLSAPDGAGRVIFFYPKDNTPGCTTEAKAFSELKGDFEALGVDIIGVSRDSLKSHESFISKQNLTVMLASDADGVASERFGVWVQKKMYGREFMGLERATFLIDHNGTVIESWYKVKVKGHAEAVLLTAKQAIS